MKITKLVGQHLIKKLAKLQKSLSFCGFVEETIGWRVDEMPPLGSLVLDKENKRNIMVIDWV